MQSNFVSSIAIGDEVELWAFFGYVSDDGVVDDAARRVKENGESRVERLQ